MDDTFESKENSKNIYVIRHKLNDLKKVPDRNYYEWQIGPFVVKIFTDVYGVVEAPYITQCETVDVQVSEVSNREDRAERGISLREDSRFKNYTPIMYDVFEGPNGIINMGDGHKMPIPQLCELIRYLYRLSNLTAFM